MQSYQEIKAFFVSAGHLKSQYVDSHCVLPISVGNAYHEGEKFSATIKLINKYFSRCTIMICDSLQRHRLAMDSGVLNADSAAAESIKNGQQWLSQQSKQIEALTIPHTVLTWQPWLDSANYGSRREAIELAYQSNNSYRSAIDETVDYFVSRYLKKQPDTTLSRNQIQSHVYEYVIEECTVMSLWVELNAAFEVYPGKQSAAMAATQVLFVETQDANQLQKLHLNFTKVTRYYNLQDQEQGSDSELLSVPSRT